MALLTAKIQTNGQKQKFKKKFGFSIDYGDKVTSNKKKIEIVSMTEIIIQNWTYYIFITSIDSRKKVNKEVNV